MIVNVQKQGRITLRAYENIIRHNSILPVWPNPSDPTSLPFKYGLFGSIFYFINCTNDEPSYELKYNFHTPTELLQILRSPNQEVESYIERFSSVARGIYKETAKEPEKEFISFQIHILGEETNSRDFSTVISLATEVHTNCWLFAQGRFEDIINYSETDDISFEKEAGLIISKIRKGSWWIDFMQFITSSLPLILAGGGLAGFIKVVLGNVKTVKEINLLGD